MDVLTRGGAVELKSSCSRTSRQCFHGRILDEFSITKVHNGVSNQVIDIHYGAEDWE